MKNLELFQNNTISLEELNQVSGGARYKTGGGFSYDSDGNRDFFYESDVIRTNSDGITTRVKYRGITQW